MNTVEKAEIDNEVWENYRQTKDPQIRDRIIMAYLPIIKVNAKKMSSVYKNHAEIEDIVNQGVLALIDCIDKYDWKRGVKFDTYVSIRVRGSIIDYIRKQDWVPRGVRKRSIDIDNAYSALQNELGRTPTDVELSQRLHISVDELNKTMGESLGFSVLSYEELLQDNTAAVMREQSAIKTPEQRLQENEIKKAIAEAIDELNDKEKTVISLYYFEELKIKEIAFVLGLTESRISQLHSKALMKLRHKIGNYLKE